MRRSAASHQLGVSEAGALVLRKEEYAPRRQRRGNPVKHALPRRPWDGQRTTKEHEVEPIFRRRVSGAQIVAYKPHHGAQFAADERDPRGVVRPAHEEMPLQALLPQALDRGEAVYAPSSHGERFAVGIGRQDLAMETGLTQRHGRRVSFLSGTASATPDPQGGAAARHRACSDRQLVKVLLAAEERRGGASRLRTPCGRQPPATPGAR